MPRLRKQKHANLSDVGSRGDVYQVIFIVWIKGVADREIMQRAEHLFKIPSVLHGDHVTPHLGLRRYSANVRRNGVRQLLDIRLKQQLEPVNHQVLMLTQTNSRAPTLPAIGAVRRLIKDGAQKTDDYLFSHL